MKCNYLNT